MAASGVFAAIDFDEEKIVSNRCWIVEKLVTEVYEVVYRVTDSSCPNLTAMLKVEVKSQEDDGMLETETEVVKRLETRANTIRRLQAGKQSVYSFLAITLCDAGLLKLKETNKTGKFNEIPLLQSGVHCLYSIKQVSHRTSENTTTSIRHLKTLTYLERPDYNFIYDTFMKSIRDKPIRFTDNYNWEEKVISRPVEQREVEIVNLEVKTPPSGPNASAHYREIQRLTITNPKLIRETEEKLCPTIAAHHYDHQPFGVPLRTRLSSCSTRHRVHS
ncbi:hypothetical protein M3Y95_00915300 [Aphelenchoides besseyi]|nr:hypothetical protein M3Y95_00915300 [Aphelenchoides besseyi]